MVKNGIWFSYAFKNISSYKCWIVKNVFPSPSRMRSEPLCPFCLHIERSIWHRIDLYQSIQIHVWSEKFEFDFFNQIDWSDLIITMALHWWVVKIVLDHERTLALIFLDSNGSIVLIINKDIDTTLLFLAFGRSWRTLSMNIY